MKMLLLTLAVISADPIGDAEYSQLHESLQPSKDELWRSIPWETSLLTAQAKAAKNGKPIFIWAMDGHPLGCT